MQRSFWDDLGEMVRAQPTDLSAGTCRACGSAVCCSCDQTILSSVTLPEEPVVAEAPLCLYASGSAWGSAALSAPRQVCVALSNVT